MRYRNVSLDEMVVLEHEIKAHRQALLVKGHLLTEVVRSVKHRARANLKRAERELILMAGEVEGQAITVYGREAWNRAWNEHRQQCTDEKAVAGQCVRQGSG